MIVAGLDLATCSGCAVLDGARVLHVEAYRASGANDGEIFFTFRKWLRKTLIQYRVQSVAVEQPLRTPSIDKDGELSIKSQMSTYLRLYGLRAHAVETCARLGIDCREVNQASWRKAFTGNGRASKEDVLALAQKIVPGLKSTDVSDAIGVAWWLNGELRIQQGAK